MGAQAPTPPFRLNIEECVRFLGRDPAWPRKLGLGILWSLLSFTIVGAFFVQGYMLLLMERVARADPQPLPEWNDYGGLLRRGWRVFVTNFVYRLPIILLALLIGVLMFGAIIALISAATTRSGANPGPNPLVFSPLAFLAIIPLVLVTAVLGFVVGLIVPAAQAQLVLHERLDAAFDIGAVFAFIRRDLGQYAIALALQFGVGLLLGGLSFSTRFTTTGGGGGRQFWLQPVFIITIFATLILLAVHTIARSRHGEGRWELSARDDVTTNLPTTEPMLHAPGRASGARREGGSGDAALRWTDSGPGPGGWADLPGGIIRRTGRGERRDRLHHFDDRLSGGGDRSVVQRADRLLHLPADRQLRRHPRR